MASPYFSNYDTEYTGDNYSSLILYVAVEAGKSYQIKIYSPIYNFTTNFNSSVNGTIIKSFSLYASETVECSVKEVGYSWSDVITVELADSTDYTSTKIPSYYPEVTHQWVWDRYNNVWYGEAGCCVANALSCLKDIHEYLEGKGTFNRYSIGWIYGNRLSTDSQAEGMIFDEALSQLKNDGVPYYKVLPENSNYINNSYNYRDVYFYNNSAPTGVTAKQLVSNNYVNVIENAKAQRIASYEKLSSSVDINSIKQHVINDGCALAGLELYDNFYDAISNGGLVPRYKTGNFTDGHMMVIMGWKKIDGINYWICQNSWGTNSGDNGLFYLPFFNDFPQSNYIVTDGDYPMPQLPTPTLDTTATVKTANSIQITINSTNFADRYYARINNGSIKSSTGKTFTFSGLTQNTQYYIEIANSGESFSDSDWAGYYATTLAMAITAWEWTAIERNVLTNNGLLTLITYLRWNELVDKIYEAASSDWRTSTVDGATLTYSSTKMTSTDKTLTANRFNSIRYNVGSRKPTGIARVYKGDIVYGSYFITLETKLNEWINNP